MGAPVWVCAAVAAAGLLAGVGAALWQRRKTRRILQNLNRMLDAAIDGRFAGRRFDETLLSSVENKLDKYLSASAVSARNLAAEKDTIKQLIADISHQTKTPIANLLLYAQLLGEQDLPEPGAACVSALHTQAEKLSFLIASLVKLSRLETGILALQPALHPIGPLLDEVMAQLAPKAAEKGIGLDVEAAGASALFDPKWTAEAVANLVDNAVKYTPAGGCVGVSVTAYALFCRIDVADSGIGIAEAEQAKVFSRFYRSPAVGGEEGVGIGLYLARQIVAGQGGYIKLASAPGAGSTFSVFLPRPG